MTDHVVLSINGSVVYDNGPQGIEVAPAVYNAERDPRNYGNYSSGPNTSINSQADWDHWRNGLNIILRQNVAPIWDGKPVAVFPMPGEG